MQPVIFISHGPPSFAIEDNATTRFWTSLAQALVRPKAILCISAHWLSRHPKLNSNPAPSTLHDFGGFPAALNTLEYPAPGAPGIAHRAAQLLGEACGEVELDSRRGFDHGVWVPLRWLFPAADVPVFNIAVQPRLDAAWHWRMGRALAALREDDNVLILGSGGATHNLAVLDEHADAPVSAAARQFDAWLAEVIAAGDVLGLQNYLHAPYAAWNHPTPEHFLPLMVAAGAAAAKPSGELIHHGFVHGNLSLAAYRWN